MADTDTDTDTDTDAQTFTAAVATGEVATAEPSSTPQRGSRVTARLEKW